jgi:hypothetical protein
MPAPRPRQPPGRRATAQILRVYASSSGDYNARLSIDESMLPWKPNT